MVAQFGEAEWPAMQEIINHESGFNLHATNKSSGACGLFQALPCKKMGCELSDAVCQANWGAGYVKARYGTPSNALAFWNAHKWY